MTYANMLFGPEGEQFNTYAAASQRWPLGTLMQLQDGRKYRFASAGGSTLVIGNLLQSAANVANHVDTTAVASAVGARTPTTTLGATAATANQYAEGYFNVSVAPGSGQVYAVDNHLAVASAGILTANLAAGHAIRVALTTTSRVDLIANPYKSVIQAPATTPTGVTAGAAVSAPTTTQHGWVQTSGMASILTAGTAVLGEPVSTSGTAGAAMPSAAATDAQAGTVQRVAASTAWSDVNLTID